MKQKVETPPSMKCSELDALDLVVADQFMPDGDGWRVLEVMHRQRPDTPVIMISAAPASRPEEHAEDLRFAAEFLKPIDHNEFLTCVGRLLGLHWTHAPGGNPPPQHGSGAGQRVNREGYA